MAGSVSAATATCSHAATVQILQSNNFISSAANELKSDLTGDTNSDASLTPDTFNGVYTFYPGSVKTVQPYNGVSLSVNGVFAARVSCSSRRYYPNNQATATNTVTFYFAAAQNLGSYNGVEFFEPVSSSGLTPISFTDSRINGGQETNGFLEIRAFNTNANLHTIEIVRLVFDDASTTAPSGVMPKGSDPDWVPPTSPPPAVTPATAATVSSTVIGTSIKNKIKKLKKKQKAAKKKGKVAKAKKLKAKIKKLKKKLKAL